MSAAGPEPIATLRIELVDSDPLIWREVEVPTTVTLKTVHEIVQAAMGWWDQHLWEVRAGRRRYGPRMGGDDDWGGEGSMDAGKVRLSEVLKPRRTVLDYTYDFGDGWEHRLVFTAPRPGAQGVAYPRYVAGEHPAPPEDCGGLPGFYDSLDALADPDHPDRAQIAEWFEGYDPEALEVETLAAAVDRIASRRRPGAGRKRRAEGA